MGAEFAPLKAVAVDRVDDHIEFSSDSDESEYDSDYIRDKLEFNNDIIVEDSSDFDDQSESESDTDSSESDYDYGEEP